MTCSWRHLLGSRVPSSLTRCLLAMLVNVILLYCVTPLTTIHLVALDSILLDASLFDDA